MPPLPKPPGQRVRRNKDQSDWKQLPAGGSGLKAPPLPTKKRLRRLLQRLLAGRRWPASGEDEFFRKAVRRHELFWVRALGE